MALVINYDPAKSSIERPIGLQQAVVTNVTDLGSRPDPFKEGSMKRQIAVTFQLQSTYTNKEGKVLPLQQTEIYTLSLHEKSKLRGILEGITGKNFGSGVVSFDIDSIVGMSCMLTLKRKDGESGFTTVVATAPLMANMVPLTIVPMPIPAWIINMRDGTGKPTDPSSSLSDADIAALMAKV